MIALDSSVVIACFGSWHEHHLAARMTLEEDPRLPAHAGLEAYSVLTRLPEPFRAEPDIVAEFLRRSFTSDRLLLAADDQARLPQRLAGLGFSGGAVYDAVIGLTAVAVGAELVTLDRRAMANYERCSVPVRMLV
ncbi:MAG: PIN domain-containing protein [Pseudonocardia sp.]|nr:PIN domain-containing protein [Pseudonocardia sp.]